MEGEVIFEKILSNNDILKHINTQRFYISIESFTKGTSKNYSPKKKKNDPKRKV